ncbi:hypothetical protein P7C70_g2903, partial [Phenoliferia sp. Uapishka_3]
MESRCVTVAQKVSHSPPVSLGSATPVDAQSPVDAELDSEEAQVRRRGWEQWISAYERGSIPLNSTLSCPPSLNPVERGKGDGVSRLGPGCSSPHSSRFGEVGQALAGKDDAPESRTWNLSTDIHLPTNIPVSITNGGDPSAPPPRLPIGSVCIVDKESHGKGSFTPQDAFVLKGFSEMIGRELLLEWESSRRAVIASQTAFLGAYLKALLVNTGRPADVDEPEDTLIPTIRNAADQLRFLTSADSCAFLDLRAFRAPPSRPGLFNQNRPSSPDDSHAPDDASVTGLVAAGSTRRHSLNESLVASDVIGSLLGQGEVTVLAEAGGHDWEAALRNPGSNSAVSHALLTYNNTGLCEFNDKTKQSPMRALEPEPTDVKFVENIGSVSMGGLLRRSVMEADRAKLRFLSQISHELRSPLHGIRSNLELIKTVIGAQALTKIKPLLNFAEICVTSLKEVLDDTLEFAKLSNTSKKAWRSSQLRDVNLETLLDEVIKSCWARTTQEELAFGGSQTDGSASRNVDIVMDYRIPRNASYLVDVGGLKRVCDSICQRMGGSLYFESVVDVGTTAYVTLPLKLISGTPSMENDSSEVRIVSDELRAMLDVSGLSLSEPEAQQEEESKSPTKISNGVPAAYSTLPLKAKVLVVDDNLIGRFVGQALF